MIWPAMFDTHCHLTVPQLHAQVDAVLDRAEGVGVRGAITVATGADDAQLGRQLAHRDPRVWCTSGVHPHRAVEDPQWNIIAHVARDERCVAWGELGLDWHYPDPPREAQFACLEAHLDLIESCRDEGLEMPIVVHCRKSHEDLLQALERRDLARDKYIFHCFTGTPEEAQAILDFGAWISFTGVVTFASAPEVAQAATLVPLDRLLLETDSPYLSPEPVRKMRPNEPANVVHTARFLAALLNRDVAEIESVTDANTERLFGIEVP
jgi:TatD DNase family protein